MPYRSTVLPTVLVLVLLALTGCSGGDGSSADRDAGAGKASGNGAATERSLPRGRTTTKVDVGTVVGRLGKARRKKLVQGVGHLVDRWYERAYLDEDYPRTHFRQPFRGFIEPARQRAMEDRATLTAAPISRRIGGVVPRHRSVHLHVLSPDGRPAGVTARFRLGFDVHDKRLRKLDRAVVAGRLMLTRVPQGWRVFGYDVTSDLPARQKKQSASSGENKKKQNKKKGGRR